MGRFLITGSSAGLGLMAGQRLLAQGHQVVLHARNKERAEHAWAATPSASAVVIGDLSSIAETRDVADQANRLGRFDAVIHNAGVGDREGRVETVDGLEHIFAINVLAPYLLTALIDRPGRLVYRRSGLLRSGTSNSALGSETQAWLAVGEDSATMASGAYFYHKSRQDPDPAARDLTIQDVLL